MKRYGKVKSTHRPPTFVVKEKNVFVSTNIEEYEETVDNEVNHGYKYDYVSYDKDEFISLLSEKNANLESELLDTQSALCDLYELVEGGLE